MYNIQECIFDKKYPQSFIGRIKCNCAINDALHDLKAYHRNARYMFDVEIPYSESYEMIHHAIGTLCYSFSTDDLLFKVSRNNYLTIEYLPISYFVGLGLDIQKVYKILYNFIQTPITIYINGDYNSINFTDMSCIDDTVDMLYKVYMESIKDQFPSEYDDYIKTEKVDERLLNIEFFGFSKKFTNGRIFSIFEDNAGDLHSQNSFISNGNEKLKFDAKFDFAKNKKNVVFTFAEE